MAVLLTDADGLVIYANQEATAMAAAAGRSLLGGRPLAAMLEASCRQAAGEQIRRAAAGRGGTCRWRCAWMVTDRRGRRCSPPPPTARTGAASASSWSAT